MLPRIGSKYVKLSDEGMFISSDSCINIHKLVTDGPPSKPSLPPPPEPPIKPPHTANRYSKARYKQRVDEYPQAVQRHQMRIERLMKDYEDFCNLKFNHGVVGVLGAPALDSNRIFANMSFHGEPVLVDVLTGCIFMGDTCLSSDMLVLRSVGPIATTKTVKLFVLKNRGRNFLL